MGIEVTALSDILNKVGSYGLLILFVIGLYARWWVMGWYARRLEDELDAYKEAALRSTDIAEQYHNVVTTRRRTRP